MLQVFYYHVKKAFLFIKIADNVLNIRMEMNGVTFVRYRNGGNRKYGGNCLYCLELLKNVKFKKVHVSDER